MAKAPKQKKPHPGRQRAGKEVAAKGHPGPWGSVLWDHLEDIRKWRMARTKWEDVVVLLKEQKGVTITPAAARNFFVRSRNPNLKLPDYLEHLRAQASPYAPLSSPTKDPRPDNQSIVEKMKARAAEKQETKPENTSTWETLNPENL